MRKKSPISNVQITPPKGTSADIEIRPGSISIRFRNLTIAEQVAARDGQSEVRVTSSESPANKD